MEITQTEGDITPQDLIRYVPTMLGRDKIGPHLLWQYAGDERLGGTILTDVALRFAAAFPERAPIRTEVDILHQFNAVQDGLAPDGFVFHMGRCGSTLVSNALHAVRGAIALAEPLALANLLAPYLPLRILDSEERWRAERPDLIRGAVACFGRRRLGDERRYFIKFTDTNLHEIPLMKSLFPRTPRLFIYRDPLEVLVSLLTGPPEWLLLRMHPAAYLGLDPVAVRTMWMEEYCARLLGNFCRAIAEMIDDRTALLNYADINEESIYGVCEFFGVDRSEVDSEALAQALWRHTKSGAEVTEFVADSDRKRRAASDLMREMIARHATGPYENLERLRTTHGLAERLQAPAARS